MESDVPQRSPELQRWMDKHDAWVERMKIKYNCATLDFDSPANIAKANRWIDEHNAWIAQKTLQYGCTTSDIAVPHLQDPHTLIEDARSLELPVDQIVASATAKIAVAHEVSHAAARIAAYQRTIADRETGPVAIYASQEATAAEAVSRTAKLIAVYNGEVAKHTPYKKSYCEAMRAAATAAIAIGAIVAVTEAYWGVYDHYTAIAQRTDGHDAAHASEQVVAILAVADTTCVVACATYLIAEQQHAIVRANLCPFQAARTWVRSIYDTVCQYGTTQQPIIPPSAAKAKED